MIRFNLIICVALTLLFGCAKSKPINSTFQWPSSGNAEADSLILLYEQARTHIGIEVSNDSIVNQLCSIADKYPQNRILQFRSKFFSSLKISSSQKDSLKKTLSDVSLLIDSSKFVYDWNYLKLITTELESDMSTRYRMLNEILAYYQSHKMRYEAGRTLISLGNVMYFLNDTIRALDYYKSAEKMFANEHLFIPLIITQLNIAMCSPIPVRDSIYSRLLANDDIKKNDFLRERVLHNSYIYTDSLPLLNEAIQISERRNYHDVLPILWSLKGKYFTDKHAPEVGLIYINKGFSYMNDNIQAIVSKPEMLWHKACAFKEMERYDSCANTLFQFANTLSETEHTMNKHGIILMDTNAKIKFAEQTEQLKRYQIWIWTVTIITIALCVIFILIYMLKDRSEKNKLAKERHDKQQIQKRQAINAQAMVLKENEKLISEITNQILELRDSNQLDSNSMESILKILRIYKSSEDTRASYLQLSNDIDASFSERLKSDHPSLSVNQIKLASMIAAGLDSHRISNLMNIEYASVYRGRSRLRIKLGLSQEESLEEYLRRYNS